MRSRHNGKTQSHKDAEIIFYYLFSNFSNLRTIEYWNVKNGINYGVNGLQ